MNWRQLLSLAALVLAGIPADAFAQEWWTVHSTPNWITGIAQNGRSLYCSTTGGLAVWSLDDRQRELIRGPILHDGWQSGVAVSPDGDLWVANQDAGLARWSQGRWSYIDVEQGLPVHECRCVLAAANGDVWAGFHQPFQGYLVRISGGTVTVWSQRDGLTGGTVNGLAEAADGTIWIATRRGAASFDGNSFEIYGPAQGLASELVRAVACGANGAVWFATDLGVSRLMGGLWRTFGVEDGLPSADVLSVAVCHGTVWAGTTLGAARWGGAVWQPVTAEQGGPQLAVRAIAPAEANGVWLGTDGEGVCFFAEPRVRFRLSEPALIPDNSSRGVIADGDGILWACTAQGGIGRYDGDAWTNWADGGLAEHEFRAITLDPVGRVWAASFGGGFYRYDGSHWRAFTTEDGLPDNYAMAMAVSPGGDYWFATANNGVARFDGKTWAAFSTEDGLAHWRVYWIDFEGRDKVWFTTDDGVSVFDGAEWKSYNEEDGLVFHRTYTMDIDSRGVKWFGSCRGVTRYDGSTWTGYLMDNSGLPFYRCNSIVVGHDDTVWIGTGRGLAHFNPFADSWRVYTPIDGLPGWDVLKIWFDANGNLWTACRGGGVGCLHLKGPEPSPRLILAGARFHWQFPNPTILIAAIPDLSNGRMPVREIDVFVSGHRTGAVLRDRGQGGDVIAGDGIYTLELQLATEAVPGRYGFELCPRDYYGTSGKPWPYLVVGQ